MAVHPIRFRIPGNGVFTACETPSAETRVACLPSVALGVDRIPPTRGELKTGEIVHRMHCADYCSSSGLLIGHVDYRRRRRWCIHPAASATMSAVPARLVPHHAHGMSASSKSTGRCSESGA